MNSKNSPVNAVLMALVGILVGFIGGYLVGQDRGAAGTFGAAGANPFQTSATANCPHSLDAKDNWILAGFRCPNTDESQALLSDCHCTLSHAIHDLVKADLQGGKAGQDIRDALVAQYGARLNFAGQESPVGAMPAGSR